MKRLFLLIAIISTLLSACSSNVDKSINLYQTEIPLEVNVSVPNQLTLDKENTISVLLTQNGNSVTSADFVHFEIVKQDGNINYGMSEATNNGDGIYSKQITFDSNGLYFITIHAGNNGSIIKPTKQFIVGTLTENDKLFLQQNTPIQEINHNGHH